MKSLTITSQQLKFVGGVFLACLIIFGIWWFMFHNRYERITEKNFMNLAKAINETCSDGVGKEIDFFAPQAAGFKGTLYQVAGTLPGGIKDVGRAILGTQDVGIDPYFYIYYEHFPNEMTGVWMIAPWSEEMPWSSNLLATASFDILFFGMDVGTAKIGKGLSSVVKKGPDAAKEVAEMSLERLSLEGLETAWDTGKRAINIIKEGKVVLKIGGEYAAAWTLCYVFTDRSWQECLIYGAVGTALFEAGKAGLGKVKDKFVVMVKEKVLHRMSRDTFEKMVKKAAKDGDKEVINVLTDPAKYGYKFKPLITEAVEDGQIKYVIKEEYYEYLEEFWKGSGKPIEKGNFIFELSTKDKLKRVLLKPVDGIEKMTDDALGRLGKTIVDVAGDDVVGHSGVESIVKNIDDMDTVVKDGLLKQFKEHGLSVPDDIFNKASKTLKEGAENGNVILMEKGTALSKVIKSDNFEEEFGRYLKGLAGIETNEYFEQFAKNPDEYRHLYGLLGGKTVNIADEAKSMIKGTLGYSILRIQDLYTPLGATYWDLKVSPVHLSVGSCDPGSLCLTSGSLLGLTRGVTLDECVDRGIDIKLRRDEINWLGQTVVPADPDFYVVSPCFAHLTISKKYKSPETAENNFVCCEMEIPGEPHFQYTWQAGKECGYMGGPGPVPVTFTKTNESACKCANEAGQEGPGCEWKCKECEKADGWSYDDVNKVCTCSKTSEGGTFVYVEPKICNKESRPEEFQMLGNDTFPNYCWASHGLANFYVTTEAGAWVANIAGTIINFFVPGAEIVGDLIQIGLDVARETMTAYPYVAECVQPPVKCPS